MSRPAVEVDDAIPPLLSSGVPVPQPCLRSTAAAERAQSPGLPPPPPTVFGEVAAPAQSFLVLDGAVISGNMSHLSFQDFTVVECGAVLRPPLRSSMNYPLAQCPATVAVGAFTVIGAESVCEAAAVGKYVRVDRRCVIGCGVTVPDGVWLREGSWVPPEAVLSPFTVYGGCPAVALGKRNPDACKALQMEHVRSLLAAAAAPAV